MSSRGLADNSELPRSREPVGSSAFRLRAVADQFGILGMASCERGGGFAKLNTL